MAEIKRSYNIPLRREFLKVPRYKRSKKAITAIKEFTQKHMKATNVVIMEELNELIWKNGIKNPPHHVKVIMSKNDDGSVFVQLEGLEIKDKKKENEDKKVKNLQEKIEAETDKAKETTSKEEKAAVKETKTKEEKPVAKETKTEEPATKEEKTETKKESSKPKKEE